MLGTAHRKAFVPTKAFAPRKPPASVPRKEPVTIIKPGGSLARSPPPAPHLPSPADKDLPPPIQLAKPNNVAAKPSTSVSIQKGFTIQAPLERQVAEELLALKARHPATKRKPELKEKGEKKKRVTKSRLKKSKEALENDEEQQARPVFNIMSKLEEEVRKRSGSTKPTAGLEIQPTASRDPNHRAAEIAEDGQEPGEDGQINATATCLSNRLTIFERAMFPVSYLLDEDNIEFKRITGNKLVPYILIYTIYTIYTINTITLYTLYTLYTL